MKKALQPIVFQHCIFRSLLGLYGHFWQHEMGRLCFFLFILCRIESKHEVTILGGLNEFSVKFFGPAGSK